MSTISMGRLQTWHFFLNHLQGSKEVAKQGAIVWETKSWTWLTLQIKFKSFSKLWIQLTSFMRKQYNTILGSSYFINHIFARGHKICQSIININDIIGHVSMISFIHGVQTTYFKINRYSAIISSLIWLTTFYMKRVEETRKCWHSQHHSSCLIIFALRKERNNNAITRFLQFRQQFLQDARGRDEQPIIDIS